MQHSPFSIRALLADVLLALTLATALAACGGGSDSDADASSSSSSSSQASSAASSSASSSESAASSSAATVLAADDFTTDLSRWQLEQESVDGRVSVANGVLDITQPAGATLWFKQAFSGDYEIRFTARPIPYTVTVGGKTYTDRISDLNMFWNATDPATSNPDPTLTVRDGKLASYNALYLYYVGFGANGNSTTRLRNYDGSAARPQITGYATAASRTAADTAGDMTPATSLVANTPVKVRVVSRAATVADKATLKWYANDVLVFSYEDPAPRLSGWFGFRTTVSHWQLSDFSVVRH
ncbi:MAG: DUF6250 domain-containing protein [Candidatus Dactylopiibacterium sp.]|nr:DUF6250 domain-containing protein [Candidatus Dactylopiibacterium sp.]